MQEDLQKREVAELIKRDKEAVKATGIDKQAAGLLADLQRQQVAGNIQATDDQVFKTVRRQVQARLLAANKDLRHDLDRALDLDLRLPPRLARCSGRPRPRTSAERAVPCDADGLNGLPMGPVGQFAINQAEQMAAMAPSRSPPAPAGGAQGFRNVAPARRWRPLRSRDQRRGPTSRQRRGRSGRSAPPTAAETEDRRRTGRDRRARNRAAAEAAQGWREGRSHPRQARVVRSGRSIRPTRRGSKSSKPSNAR